MIKPEFMEFYDNVVKKLGERFETEYPQFTFCNHPSSLYEEYLNQKTMLRFLTQSQGRYFMRTSSIACQLL